MKLKKNELKRFLKTKKKPTRNDFFLCLTEIFDALLRKKKHDKIESIVSPSQAHIQ
jgi:hypothetical protein